MEWGAYRAARGVSASLLLAAAALLLIPSAHAIMIGPDSSGYYGIDSLSGGPVLSMSDLNSTTALTMADESQRWIDFPPGFDFTFYNQTAYGVNVSDNGFLSLINTSNAYSSTTIPSATTPNGVVAGFWDDLDPSTGSIKTATLGSAPTRTVVTAWSNVREFGTSTAEGEWTLKDPLPDAMICDYDADASSSASGDVLYLSIDGTETTVGVGDIRLTAFSGHAAGTYVGANDADFAALVTCHPYTVAYADVDFSGTYTAADYVYLGYDKNTAQLVEGSATNGDWWVRITQAGSFAAGTITAAPNNDVTNFGSSTIVLPGAEVAWTDDDITGTWSAGDSAYVTSAAISTGDYLPARSIRVRSPTQVFGTTAHYGPLQPEGLPLTDPLTDATICHVNADGTNGVANDWFYLDPFGSDTSVRVNDLRIVAANGHPAGSLVTSSDAFELTQSAECHAYSVAYYDTNSNGLYDVGDSVMVGYNRATASLVEASTDAGDWWIRLTRYGSLNEGTPVVAGQSDLITFGSGAILSGAEFAYDDLDSSGSLTIGDQAYITGASVVSGDYAPAKSVRILHPSFAFGSLVAYGGYSLEGGYLKDPSPDAMICHHDTDGGANVAGDGFYLSMTGTETSVKIGDTRLVSVGGHPAGSVVISGDADIGQSLDCQAYTIATIDEDPNGYFDSGDYLYIGYNKNTASLLEASANAGDWWIRLTTTSGGGPGSVVLFGSFDLLGGTPSAVLTGSEIAWDDLDASNTYTAADNAYVTSVAVQTSSYVPGNSVRLHHQKLAMGSFVTPAPLKLVNLQIDLHETTDDIDIEWASAQSDGGTHTVGIEDPGGAVGLQYERSSSDISDRAVRFSKTGPIETLISPEPSTGWQTSPSTTYTFTCTKPYSGGQNCGAGYLEGIYVDGALVVSANTDTNGHVVYAPTLSDGIHTLAWNATKTGYPNEYQKTRTLRIDTTPPSVWANNFTCASPAGFWCLADETVAASSSDATSGIASMVCQLDGITVACAPTVVSSEGRHRWYVNATDNAGLVTSQPYFFGVDKTDPTIGLSSSCTLAGNNGWCRGTLNILLFESDSGSGILGNISGCSDNNVTRSCSNFSTTDGPHYIQAQAYDVAGRATNATLFVKRDATNPALTLTSTCAAASFWCISSSSFTLGVTDGTSGISSSACSDNNATIGCVGFTISADGGHYVQMSATDLAGNTATTDMFRGMDGTAPSAPITWTCALAGSGNWCRGDIAVTFVQSDATSGVSTAVCSVDNVTTPCTTLSYTTDGQRYVQANVVDKAGNVANQTIRFQRDSTPPTVSWSSTCAAASLWCNADISINYARSDVTSGIGSESCTDNNATISCASLLVTSDGAHYAKATVTDSAGNLATGDIFRGRDTVAPAIPLAWSCSGGGNASWCKGTISITFTTTDALSGVSTSLCTQDNLTVLPCTSVSYSTDGSRYVQANVTDKAGNFNNATFNARRDGTAPTASFSTTCGTPGNAGWCKSASYTYSTAQSDLTSGLAAGEPHCYLDNAATACSGTVSTQGAHTLLLTAADVAGNTMSTSAALGIDSIAPVAATNVACTFDPTLTWCRSAATISDASTDATSGLGTQTCTMDGAATGCGTFVYSTGGAHTFVRNVADGAGNSASASTPVRIDMQAPSLTLAFSCATPGSAGWCRSDISIILTHSDSTSGEASAVCSDNNATIACASYAITSDGPHFVQANIIDNAGNVANQTLLVLRDATPPTVSWSSSCGATSLWCSSDITFTYARSDAASGVATESCTDNNVTRACSTFTVTADGGHYLQASVTDVAGNSAASAPIFRGRDATAPSLTLSSSCPAGGLNGWCKGDITVTLTHGDATGGEASAVCTDNNVTRACSGFSITTDSSHFIQAQITDTAGNVANQTGLYRRDATIPSLTLTSDCAAASLWCSAASVGFTISVSDATSGVATTACSDNNATRTCSTFSFASDGGHFVQAQVTDAAGNVANQTIFRGRDVTPPSAPITSTCALNGNLSWCRGNVVVTFVLSDATSGVASSACSADNATIPCTSSTLSADGTHYFQAQVTDLAGNVANLPFNAKRDATVPTASFSTSCASPGGTGWCKSASYTYSTSQSDATSGLAAGEPHCYLDNAAVACSGTVSTQGAHTLLLTAADVAGNTMSTSSALAIDSVPPTVVTNVACTLNAAQTWCHSAATITDGSTDATSGIASETCWLDAASTPCSTTVSADAAHSFARNVTDNAGNFANTSRAVNVDKTTPSVTIAQQSCSLAGSNGWCRGTANMLISISDVTSGIRSSVCTLDNATATCGSIPVSSDGLHFVQADAFDVADNEGNATQQVKRDATAPSAWSNLTCGGQPLGSGCSGNVQLQAAASDALSGSPAIVCELDGAATSCSGIASAAGNHRFYVNATDAAGNLGGVSRFFLIDTTPPVVQISTTCLGASQSGWCRAAVNYAAFANDTDSGIASGPTCTLAGSAASCNAQASGDGSRALAASATNTVGTSGSASATIAIDTATPTITITPTCTSMGNSSWCRGTWNIVVATSDATSGMLSTTCTIDATPFACGSTGTIATDGTHTVRVDATDVAGNTITQTTTLKRDATPPAGSFTKTCATPGNAGWCRSASYTIATTTSDATSGVASGEPHCYQNNAAVPCTATISGEGAHALLLTVADQAGNTAPANDALAIDSIPPVAGTSVACTFNNALTWCRSDATLTNTSSDGGSGIMSASCTLDGSAATCGALTIATEGVHTYARTVTDVAGNPTTRTDTVRVDKTPAQLTLTDVCAGTAANGWCPASDEPRASASDAGSGPQTLACTWDGAAHACSGTSESIDGTHTFSATATDVAGNSASASSTIRIDRTLPSVWLNITCSDARASGWCRASSIDLVGEASDATSGVSTKTCSFDPACAGRVSGDGTYTFRIDATDVAGNANGSTVIMGIDTARPILSASTPNAGGAIALAWSAPNAVAPVTGYVLERAVDADLTQWTVVRTGASTTFTDTGLRDDAEYTYRVTTQGAAGPSDPSDLATARTLRLPGAPTHLTATASGAGVHLAWNAPTDTGGSALTGYTVYRRTDSGVSGEDAINVGPSQRTLDDTPPTGGKALGDINYTVVARTVAGPGPRSNTATFRYAAQAPVPAPSDPREQASSAVPFERDWLEETAPASGSQTTKVVLASSDGLTLFEVGTKVSGAEQDIVATARNAVTGAITWTKTFTSGPHTIDHAYAAALAPDGSALYVTGSASGDYGTIAFSTTNGAIRWSTLTSFPGGNSVGHAIEATGGAVVVTGTIPGDGRTDAMTLALAPGTGQILWQAKLASPGADDAVALAISNGVAYVGATSSDDLAAIGYRVSDGAIAWPLHTFGTDAQERLAGLAIAGSQLVLTGTQQGASSDDIITAAFDATSGALTWSATYDSTPLLDPTPRADQAAAIANSTDGSTVYIVGRATGPSGNGRDALVIAYNAATGARLWDVALDSGVGADDEALAVAPAKDDLRVYVAGSAAGDAAVWALTSTGGAVAWNDTFAHAGRDAARSVAVATDGRVYVGGDVGGVEGLAIAYGPVPLTPATQSASGGAFVVGPAAPRVARIAEGMFPRA